MSAAERKLAPSASREAALRALQARKPRAPQQEMRAQPQVAFSSRPASAAPKYEPNYEAATYAMEQVDEVEEILKEMQAALKKRTRDVDGTAGIRGLGRNFRICDGNGNGTLDLDEFAKCVRLCQLGLNGEQVAKLHAHFDRDGSGAIDYEEFLRAVRGPLSASRRKVVLQVFHALDGLGDGNGVLTVEGACAI